ncbi:hypothetical protein [Caulobacter sp. CCH5-E12]|uniref:hypothetical protein n=1 Tax=Caulobacter sp. CCH5-E12 TaxID=1768770 RepID=UPI0012E3B8CA|nr:hypothetical protein [Caulobacter sp. CCH5-E12]
MATTVTLAGGLNAPAHAAGVCERGYVTEIVVSAQQTVRGRPQNWPRVLFRTDGTGFLPPTISDGYKVSLNNRSYTEISLEPGDNEMDFRNKLAALNLAFLSRTPVQVYSDFGSCEEASKHLQIMLCSGESACNKQP